MSIYNEKKSEPKSKKAFEDVSAHCDYIPGRQKIFPMLKVIKKVLGS